VIDAGSPSLRGRSGGSTFLLSINVVPPMSWRVANGAIKTGAGNIPLFAWIKEKKGSLTEAQRQADVQIVRDRLSSIDKKVRFIALGLSGLGTVILVVGILFGISGSRFIIVGAGLSTIGLFMLIVGLAFLLSRRMRPAALRQKEG